MHRVILTSNLDAFKTESWPIFNILPHKGDIICSARGLELEVHSIRHTYDGDIIVSLWLPQGRFTSLADFLSWYDKTRSQKLLYAAKDW
jgi:hypothetical protein